MTSDASYTLHSIPFTIFRVSQKSTQSGHHVQPSHSSTTPTTSSATHPTGMSTTRALNGRSARTQRRRTHRATMCHSITMRSRPSSISKSRRTEAWGHKRSYIRCVFYLNSPSPITRPSSAHYATKTPAVVGSPRAPDKTREPHSGPEARTARERRVPKRPWR